MHVPRYPFGPLRSCVRCLDVATPLTVQYAGLCVPRLGGLKEMQPPNGHTRGQLRSGVEWGGWRGFRVISSRQRFTRRVREGPVEMTECNVAQTLSPRTASSASSTECQTCSTLPRQRSGQGLPCPACAECGGYLFPTRHSCGCRRRRRRGSKFTPTLSPLPTQVTWSSGLK